MLQRTGFALVAAIAPTLSFVPLAGAAPPTATPPPVPAAATLLPANTASAMLLDMRRATWRQLEQYAIFQVFQQGQPPTEAGFDPGSLPLLPLELSYTTDIEPWVGETVILALLPLPAASVEVSTADHEVLIAPIAEPLAFEGFVNTVAALRDDEPLTETYQTIPILYWEPQFSSMEGEASEPQLDGAGDADAVAPPVPLAPAEISVLPPDESVAMEIPAAPPVELEVPPEPPLEMPPEPSSEPSLEPIPDEPGLAIAVFPDFMVAATNPAAIRAWIDLRPATESASLATNERFLRTLAHPNYDGAIGVFYASLSEVLKYSFANFALPNLPIDLPLPSDLDTAELAELAAVDLEGSVEVLIYPTPEGLRLQGRGYYDDPLLQAAVAAALPPASDAVLNQVPGDSLVVMSGQNVAAVWQSIAAALAFDEQGQEALQQARSSFTTFTGLDLDRDLFGWMDQGVTVFLFPTASSPLATFVPQLEVGVGIVLQTSDRPTAEATLAQLDEVLGNSFFPVETATFNDIPAVGWSYPLGLEPDANLSFMGHGWATDDTLVITNSLGSLAEVLALEPSQTLPNALRFAQSTRDFPEANQGYFYTNLAPVRSLVYRFFPTALTDPTTVELRQFVGAIQALSGTLSFTEDYLQLDGLMLLTPAEP